MKQCIIIVFDKPRYATSIEDLYISGSDIKSICDFDDRWESFNEYLKDDYKELSLCRDDEGLVYDDFQQDVVYGLMLVRQRISNNGTPWKNQSYSRF